MLAIHAIDRETDARAGALHTPRGDVRTPTFMPVGTSASVKMLTPQQVTEAGIEMVLGNAYHLMQRPGTGVIR